MKSLDPRWWKGKRVLVTGADGFVGQRVISLLMEWELVPSAHIRRFSLPDGDLRSSSDARWAVAGCDVVLHLAADVGGWGYSSSHSADQYYNCSAIDLAVFEAARLAGGARTLTVSCSTAYPATVSSPLVEGTLFDGPPRESHLNIGSGVETSIATLADMIVRQTGFSGAVVFNRNKPNGEPRRSVDISKAGRELGYAPDVPLEVGLQRTIDWYRQRSSA